jgi:hypothetical protein
LGEEVAQTMYTHVSKCKNDKMKGINNNKRKKKKQTKRSLISLLVKQEVKFTNMESKGKNSLWRYRFGDC